MTGINFWPSITGFYANAINFNYRSQTMADIKVKERSYLEVMFSYRKTSLGASDLLRCHSSPSLQSTSMTGINYRGNRSRSESKSFNVRVYENIISI